LLLHDSFLEGGESGTRAGRRREREERGGRREREGREERGGRERREEGERAKHIPSRVDDPHRAQTHPQNSSSPFPH
jgi:hypothetical protein